MKNFIPILFICLGCKTYFLNQTCPNSKIIKNKDSRKIILSKIDSVYRKSGDHLQKIISLTCINDSILEVKTKTNLSILDFYYFDENLKIIEIKHELPALN